MKLLRNVKFKYTSIFCHFFMEAIILINIISILKQWQYNENPNSFNKCLKAVLGKQQ